MVGTSVYLTDLTFPKITDTPPTPESLRVDAQTAQRPDQASGLDTLRSALTSFFGHNKAAATATADASGSTAPSASARPPVRPIFTSSVPANGGILPPAGENAHADKGRILKLDPVQLREWRNLQEGAQVALPAVSGDTLEGTVQLVQQEAGWTRIGGKLAGSDGSFSLNTNGEDVAGMILMPELQLGYKIEMDGADVLMVERRLGSLVCSPGIGAGQAAATDGTLRKPVAAAAAMPVINTRPGAKGVIFVDFDGETVTDPVWNAGQTINAAPSALASDQILQVLAISAQDYAPFDVTFTTDSALYAATPAGRRMHVVVTPTDTAAPGSGGVAYIDSWSGAGRAFRSDTVCWVFNQNVKSIAEAVSHEVGHTLGLSHDGQTGVTEYYAGNGGGVATPTSWAPIMGVGYSKSLVQWSKGEYAQANNTEDDIALIARSANQIGFIQNELPNGPKLLPLTGETFSAEGLLRTATSVDSYQFSTAGGALTAAVAPTSANSDVDVKLELTDLSGATIVLSDLADALSASISRTLAAGTYRLTVRPAGSGVKPVGGYTTGYSAYGSVGRYTLSGSVQGASAAPVFNSPPSIAGTVGRPLSARIEVSGASSVSVVSSALPSGLAFDPGSLLLSGTPLLESGTGAAGTGTGPGLLRLSATNSAGTTTQDFVITISKDGLPLANAFPSNIGAIITTVTAPWTGVTMLRADGTSGIVAQSAPIANNGVSAVSFEYTIPPVSGASAQSLSSVLTFYWKASTEALGNRNRSGDFVQCQVNGRIATDSETAQALYISGETGWIKQTVRLRGSGVQRVSFIYAKDGSLSKGQDRVWVYGTALGQPPVFTVQPSRVSLGAGASKFTLTTEVSGANALTWKKDFGTVTNGTSSQGSIISGATTPSLTVNNSSAADAGFYWLEAKNAYGTAISIPVEVAIAAAPVITQQPAAPVGLKLGDTLTLNATVAGGAPLFYQWTKDGQPIRRGFATSPSITLITPAATTAAAGSYSLTVTNRFGTVTSDRVSVVFSAVQSKPTR